MSTCALGGWGGVWGSSLGKCLSFTAGRSLASPSRVVTWDSIRESESLLAGLHLILLSCLSFNVHSSSFCVSVSLIFPGHVTRPVFFSVTILPLVLPGSLEFLTDILVYSVRAPSSGESPLFIVILYYSRQSLFCFSEAFSTFFLLPK